MKESTQYLYEFKNGERIRNIGFLKMEPQMDKNFIRIYAKEMDDVKGILFQKQNGEMYVGTWEEKSFPIQEEKQKIIGELEEQEMEEVDSYIIPSNVYYEKIQRQDLSRLPRKEWRLANNSFLLHGFYNYHHLLYIEEDGEIWIGVPGINHEKEKMAANYFGFTRFLRLMDVEIELNEEEINTYEDFGYWCRQIPETRL